MIDAIVCAWNEEATIADVVSVLVASGVCSRVLVVDDGSEDNTASIARSAGAEVLTMPQNGGKGAAMLAGVERCQGDIGFFDADLVGFRPDHVHQLVYCRSKGYDMVCGLRDYGHVGSMLQVATGPIITGERIVARWILDMLPDSCWSGYSIETGMNFVCDQWGGKVLLTTMQGVEIRGKVKKGGALKGLAGHFKMFGEMAATRQMLEETGGVACKI